MARIRTIKPEFCTSEQVAECSTNARLLFVCMWMFCDDAGRHPANCKRLKMEVFPGDAFTDKQIRGFVDELIGVGLLSEYTHENANFWQITGWKKHQRIEKPSYKYPPLDKNGVPIFVDSSTTIRRVLDDSSPPERNGMESNGKEGKGEDGGVADESATPQASEFDFIVSDGSTWNLPVEKINEYRKSFPELDLVAEFRKAGQWLRDNPKRRKTKTGMFAFLCSWLTRSQNSGGAAIGTKSIKPVSAGVTHSADLTKSCAVGDM